MANKGHRNGGKFGGMHTTFIPVAEVLADIAAAHHHVTNISAGFIKAGLPPAKGQRRVKITDIQGGVLLSIRDNTSGSLGLHGQYPRDQASLVPSDPQQEYSSLLWRTSG